jgi:hypothetical protein
VWVDLDCPNFLGTKGFFLVVIERHGWYLRILWRQMRILIDDKVCTCSEAAAGAWLLPYPPGYQGAEVLMHCVKKWCYICILPHVLRVFIAKNLIWTRHGNTIYNMPKEVYVLPEWKTSRRSDNSTLKIMSLFLRLRTWNTPICGDKRRNLFWWDQWG